MTKGNQTADAIVKLEQQAREYVQLKHYGEAEKTYQQLIQQNPENLSAYYELALLYKRCNQLDAALAYVNRLLTIDSQHIAGLDLIAELLCYKREYGKGELYFKKALEINANYAPSLKKLGMLYHQLGKAEQALSCFEKLTAVKADESDSWFLLGTVQQQLNQWESSFVSLKKALDIGNAPVQAAYNYAELGFTLLEYKALKERLTEIIEKQIFPRDKSHGLYIYLAKIAFLEERIEDAEALLNEALKEGEEEVDFPYFKGLLTYYNYLKRLLKLRSKHPQLYAGEASKKLYVVGESNCLSAAFTHIHSQNKVYKLIPKLIIGAQARHLAQNEHNKYQECFERTIKTLPKKSSILCVFGEIDCRINYGILPYHKQSQKPLDEIINDITENYVLFLAKMRDERSLDFSVQLVQAPNPKHELYAPEDIEKVKEIVGFFNQTLSTYATKHGLMVIDVNAASKGQEGEADADKYIDEFHLKPHVLAEAYANLQV